MHHFGNLYSLFSLIFPALERQFFGGILTSDKVKNIDTKQSNKRNIQNSKSKRQAYHMNKEKQMTGQHGPLWKPESKSGAPERLAFPAPHPAPVMMSSMSYQGMKRTYDNNIMAYRCN